MTDEKGMNPRNYRQPPSSCWDGFRIFMWNSETNEFLGRTASSWGKILLFYCVFYAVLSGFIAVMFSIFWQTLDMEQPKWQLDDSTIGTNPGIALRPMPPEARFGNTLIWYNSQQPENMTYWYDAINEFLRDYIEPKNGGNIDENCAFDHPAADKKFCPFEIESLDTCSPAKTDKKYGFPEKKPCIFLKLNKIFNWTPRLFNESSIDQLKNEEDRRVYETMPQTLKNTIANTTDARERNLIWVSCEGERPIDIENLGPIHYSPHRGFPAYYFPYRNVQGYQPPIVAVQFELPKLGVLINIECKAWAKNIIYDRTDQRGSVRFTLMID